MANKLDAIGTKRRLVRLRREVIDARTRWEKLLSEKYVYARNEQGKSNRSPLKVLYLARPDKWWKEVKKEMAALQVKIAKLGYIGSKKPRSLWLPTIIENPIEIMLKIYPAISVRKVNVGQARAFINKSGCGTTLYKGDQYSIHSVTGRNYKLRVRHKDGIIYHDHTDWSVCIFYGELPILKKPDGRPSRTDQELKNKFNDAICVYKNSALYSKQKW